MLCTNCKKHEANYYYEQNINGKVTKVALCPECAKKYGHITMKPFGAFDLLDGLFGFPVLTDTRERETKKCTLCASTFDDIVNNGKVGCARCYEVFSNELEPTVRRLHGDVRHVGRVPASRRHGEVEVDSKAETTQKAEAGEECVRELRKELSKAVKAENYEEAAKLRDRIRELESGPKEA